MKAVITLQVSELDGQITDARPVDSSQSLLMLPLWVYYSGRYRKTSEYPGSVASAVLATHDGAF